MTIFRFWTKNQFQIDNGFINDHPRGYLKYAGSNDDKVRFVFDEYDYTIDLSDDVVYVDDVLFTGTAVQLKANLKTVFPNAGGAAATTLITDDSTSVSTNEVMTASAVQDLHAPLSNGISTQVEPYIFWHRGASSMAPENTMKALRYAAARGAKFLEMDVYLLSDGSLGLCHDATIDGMTTGTGNVEDQNAISWSNLTVDCSAWLGVDWPNITGMSFFDEVLREFGNKVIIAPELKTMTTEAATVLVNMLKRYSISRDYVLVQCFSNTPLQTVRAAGYKTLMLAGSPDPATIQAQGHEFVGVPTTLTSAQVSALKAAGTKVIMYTPSTQYDYNDCITKGVNGVFSDDPLYASNTHKRLTSDPYKKGARWDGIRPNPITTGAIRVQATGYFTTPNSWGIDNAASNSYRSSLQGWGCPINGDANAQSYRIDFTNDMIGALDVARWAGIYLSNTDLPFADSAATGVNGYNILIRKSGILDIYKVTDGVGTKIGTFTGAVRTDGDSLPYRLTVSPTQITIARTDNGNTLTVTDATYRGLGYFRFASNGMNTRWKNVTITII